MRLSNSDDIRKGKTIDIDTVFRGRISSIYSVFLKGYDCIIDLLDPNNTWSDISPRELPAVEGYEELDAELYVNGSAIIDPADLYHD